MLGTHNIGPEKKDKKLGPWDLNVELLALEASGGSGGGGWWVGGSGVATPPPPPPQELRAMHTKCTVLSMQTHRFTQQ